MKNRIKFGKNDEAVSPVIGVILMVAITVILAAVIAAFVFGMGTPTKAPQASLKITADSVTGVKIYHSGGDPIVTNDEKISIYNATTGLSFVDSVSLSTFLNGNATLTPGVSLTNSTITLTNPANLAKNSIIDVKILDVPSGQFITTARVYVT